MKQDYIKQLKTILEGLEMSQNEREDILNDYAGMYEDGLEKGMDDLAIIEMLGTPEKVVEALSEEYHPIEKKKRGGKIIALMPFISLIAFFILGFGYQGWKVGWLVFLAIPVVAIIVDALNKPYKHFFTAISPFIAVVIFLSIGFGLKRWHPTWLIFFMIPVTAIINSIRETKEQDLKTSLWGQITGLMVFVSITAFILLGTFIGYWHLFWLILLLIPMTGLMNETNLTKRWVMMISIIIAAGFYLFVGLELGLWRLGLLGFLLPVGIGFLTNEIHVSFGKGNLLTKITVLLAIFIFIGSGILWQSWGYMWMVFLFVPMVAILTNGDKKHLLVALSPFIAVIIFFSLGYFFSLWTISWLAFLMIPIICILDGK